MNIVKKLAALGLALLLLTGCAGTVENEPQHVALIAKSKNSEFFKSVFAGANAASSEYDIRLTIDGPETEEDVETQNELIDKAVADGADAIVLSAISYEGNADAVNRAAAHGVKIVVFDSDVDSDRVQVRIGTDNIAAGQKAAQAAFKEEGELEIGIVNYDTSSRNGQEREKGFRMIASHTERVRRIHTINVLAEQADAQIKTMELLQENPEINVLVAFNEPTCVGAAMAVEELGLAGKIRMVGFDSNVEAVEMLQDGVISALVVQNPYAMGYLGVEAACNLLNGKSGKIYDPAALVDTPTVVVDQENMFTIEGQKVLFSFQ